MDAILMSLMTALNEGLMINVYQRDTDDFYTGYVRALGNNAVILATYNDAGIADGSVWLNFAAIAQVEFAGVDLDDMQFRISVAESEHFLSLAGQEKPLKFDTTNDLLVQLVTQVQASQQVVMVILADDDAYLEGQVVSVSDDHFQFNVFNKFNFTDKREMAVDYSDVLVVEFQGLDLRQETALVSKRNTLKHVKSALIPNDGQLGEIFTEAMATGQMLAVMPKGQEDQFFVGIVKALNADTVVLSLKDMAAQFGGYVAIRLPEIQSITTASDYLQTVKFYEQWDIDHAFTQQPVLNADREFDSSDDLIQGLIASAAAFSRVIRIRVADTDEHLLGYPTQLTATGFVMNLVNEEAGEQVPVRFDDVLELAFGHIYAYLQEALDHRE
ncbi:hypothetical protein [Lacticaseibacillus porcinae]|uniref:hypothetical protein n=1 Tax=Lacticaseibacillus porcinae TaxID=1123687 RepID=UPI000F7B5308|nr:hypothetical protein [Lacticaseibacillus porcinae]